MTGRLKQFARRLSGALHPTGNTPDGEISLNNPAITTAGTDRKPLAVVTFVWNEADYLRKWVDYYGAQVGRENLFIFAHGNDPMVHDIATGCTIYPLPRDRVDAFFARRKSDLAAGFLSFLLVEYQTVIVGDVDEMIVIDPVTGLGLLDYVAQNRARGAALKPLNLDLLDDPKSGALNLSRPVFSQRTLSRTRYQFCKPVVVSDRIQFAAGFHYSNRPPVVAEGAYLVHLHFADKAINAEIDRLRQGSFDDNPHLSEAHQRSVGFWSKHMKRFQDRNRRSRDLPIVDLDDIAPKLIAAMNSNVIQQPRTKINAPGWTMTYGDVDEKIRLRIPDRFASVF